MLNEVRASIAASEGREGIEAPIRVLIVDDDDLDRMNCRRMLRTVFSERVQIDAVGDWDAAFDALQNGAHDVYFVDYHLGGRTGIELIQSVHDPNDPKIFIMLTGQDSREADLAASAVGVTDYLIKDELSPNRLERSMRYALEAARQRRLLIEQANELRDAKRNAEAAQARAEESEEKYRWLAHHDMLTQIPNRVLFREKLRLGMQSASRSNQDLAILLLDLDRFKSVNDTRGHHVGDALLVEVAKRLSGIVRETDVVARLSGDEFAVILNNLQRGSCASVVAQKIIDGLGKPYDIQGHRVHTAASIGIAVFAPRAEFTPTDLVARADAALYRAKAAGRGQFQFFDQALDQQVRRTLKVQEALANAIQDRQIGLAFQPKIDLRSGGVVSMEALARWTHPDLGVVPPSEFVPIAESCGLILPLSNCVFEAACQAAAGWAAQGYGEISLALNLSAVHLHQSELQANMLELLARFGLSPERVELELTETAALRNLEYVKQQLAGLRAAGVQIAIDDFGTGYSSLLVATSLPSDYLKIDRSFVSGMLAGSADAAAVNATITLAHSLKLKAVAEGVETVEQWNYLRERGCDQAQGYFIARPMPADRIGGWLAAYRLGGATTSSAKAATGA